jgi:ferric-dicitrate binding protein FerR (iron transport regulator)
MENKNGSHKAEDFLTDDSSIRKIQTNASSENSFNSKEFAIATDIYSIVVEKKITLSEDQKEILGRRVAHTIYSYKRKQMIWRLSAAAVLLIIIGISVLFRINEEPDIRKFAINNSFSPMNGNTRLILSGKEEIEIETNLSNIEYAGNGNEIKIDASRQVNQKVEDHRAVLNTLVVPYGKRAQIILSDKSKVWVNSGSKLIYPAKFASDKREVFLDGEAIFEVSHDKFHPFHVLTRNIEVKDLGTVFNLSAYNDDPTTNTVLESGSVELSYKDGSLLGPSKVSMVPGMLAVYDPERRVVIQTKVNTKQYTSWREGYFTFEKQPLDGILRKISRYYNVSIQLKDQKLANETFSGSLDLRNSSSQVLEIIAEIINAKVENIDNQITITRLKSGGTPM